MIDLVLGGISSGKSAFAQGLAAAAGGAVVLAAGRAGDGEMAARIAAHRASRPAAWPVVEEERDLAGSLPAGPEVVLLESVDTWLANLVSDGPGSAGPELVDRCAGDLERIGAGRHLIAVSAEVGLSLVPLHPSGRTFAELLGRLNQRLAGGAERVHLVVAGIPVRLR